MGGNKGEAFFVEAGDADTGAALLTLEDGTLVTVTSTRYNGAGHDVRMELLGSKASIGVGYDDSLAITSAEAGVTYPAGHQARDVPGSVRAGLPLRDGVLLRGCGRSSNEPVWRGRGARRVPDRRGRPAQLGVGTLRGAGRHCVMSELTVASTAREMAAAVRDRQISARELLELHLQRIDERNGDLNAIVALDVDRARSGAASADEHLASGAPVGALHGLPFAFKDTHAVAGWRTTYGSTLFADNVPTADELLVERIRRAGVVLLGRTNTPEFAAGSHTFNKVYGTTRNPVDRTRSAGGSSGGAAAALAAGMVPLADGSDMGGSLRNPASFCGVVGLRPSLGRVPEWPHYNQWETTSVGGPMARNVSDVALLLSVLAGPDPRAPLALGDPGSALLLRWTGRCGDCGSRGRST